ncbi:MAG: nucleotide sugar dehydrogenase [Candidatus Bathyarchaeales archaeon]
MSSAIHIKPMDIENNEHRGKYTVSIIGCGRIGVLHACLFADVGFHVICADTNQAIVDNISKSRVSFLKNEIEPLLRKHANDGRLKATNDLKLAVAQGEIIMVAVPVTVDEKGRTDYSNLERALKQVGSSFRKGTLVIIASVVRIGATEGLLKEILEGVSGFKVGTDFFLAYSPVLFPERQTLKTLSEYRRIVAATDKNSLEMASTVLGTITKSYVAKTYNVKIAEAMVLFEATHEYAKIALANEFALFCEKMGVDYLAVQNLAKTNPNSRLAPPTLACENGDEALHILLDEAENLDLKLKISKAAAETNVEALKNAANLIREALKSCGKTLRRAKLSILGLSQTPNVMDVPKSSMKKLGEMLETKGAKISLYDPYLSSKASIELKQASFKKSLTEAVEGADCVIIFTGHDQFKRLNLKKLKLMVKMPAAIVDFEGVIDPGKAEAEGFIYRGLGRGVWTK